MRRKDSGSDKRYAAFHSSSGHISHVCKLLDGHVIRSSQLSLSIIRAYHGKLRGHSWSIAAGIPAASCEHIATPLQSLASTGEIVKFTELFKVI